MSHLNKGRWPLIGLVVGLVAIVAGQVYTQGEPQPTNDLPNPYRTTAPWGTRESTASAAAMPDAKASARPPSRSPMISSKAVHVGLPWRA